VANETMVIPTQINVCIFITDMDKGMDMAASDENPAIHVVLLGVGVDLPELLWGMAESYM